MSDMERFACIFFFLLLLSVLSGCRKEEVEVGLGDSGLLSLSASIGDVPLHSETRSPAFYGTYFASGKVMGLCICVNDTAQTPTQFIPFHNGTGNLKVTSRNSGPSTSDWSYYNSALNNTYTALWLTTRSDSAKAAIYGYTPYIESVADLCSIAVDFSKNMDIMWAKENGTNNRGLDPALSSLSANLNFEHLMSLLRIGVKLEISGSNHLLNYMTLIKSGSKTTPVYTSGIFNAIQGTIDTLTLTQNDSVRVTYGETRSGYENYGLFSNASGYTYFDFLIYPTDLAADGDLTLVMSIDGFRYSYVINREDVLHGDGVTCGFRKGYSYNFQFKLDNYVHLKGISIQQGWTPDNISDDM